MAVDGLILHQQLKTILPLIPARINKITQPSDSEILLAVRHDGANHQLLLCVHSQYNRLNITGLTYRNPPEPSSFVMLLRKHLENGIIVAIEQDQLDRCVKFTIKKNNEIGELQIAFLYLELMGKYANLILVNEEGRIVDAIKRIPPYENTKRIIFAGAPYQPNPRAQRKNPFTETTAYLTYPLMEQFEGFSPLLAKEVEYRLIKGENFSAIMSELESSSTIFYYPQNKSYHVIALKHLEETPQNFEINDGFDRLYAAMQDKVRVEQLTGKLFSFIKSELRKNRNKLPKLIQSYEEACDCDKWRLFGDLIFSNLPLLKKGLTSVDLYDYESDKKITVELQAKLDPRQNGLKYYQKYRKGKNGQKHLSEQIKFCHEEIEYFSALSFQLEIADLDTALEIKEELIKCGYLKNVEKRKNKKTAKLPQFSIYTCEEVAVYVGHNNLQNEYLTFKLARKEDTWFHVQNFHGSHVIIKTVNPSEKQVRFCANLAAYYSQGRFSNSVAVDYTPIKNLKKIPASRSGQVSITNYKTIYIDPEKPD